MGDLIVAAYRRDHEAMRRATAEVLASSVADAILRELFAGYDPYNHTGSHAHARAEWSGPR